MICRNRATSWIKLLLVMVLGLALRSYAIAADDRWSPHVRITTNFGVIEAELDARRAPNTVHNFLNYVDGGFYRNVLFHRVIKNFMIQGGGFEVGMIQKPTQSPINNEADNGLKNVVGTLAMARTANPHSASAQFFINTKDNAALDHRNSSAEGFGYCVFGKVTKGMEVVGNIEAVRTRTAGKFSDVPEKDVIILAIERMDRTGLSSPDFNSKFQQELVRYRSLHPKPTLSEETRRLKIQAELALREKRFFDALDRYEEALHISPWWPEGHFNGALIFAELKDYKSAIQAMNRYLQLVPEASDARAARDKIYEWESFSPRK